ncbi:hypothetical protein SDC9_31408 [bioreactor metagenome]|uniref:Uncharacterized protein n=1 Tax=bioreactor metagenome TaxID=1076179 RepID=A0A644V283_9ZZZZ
MRAAITAKAAEREAPSAANRVRDGSAVAELRFALFEEGRHALLLVLGREQRVEDAALEMHALGEGGLVGAVDAFLHHHRAHQRFLGDLVRRGHRVGQQLGQRHDAADKARAFRLGRIHEAAGQMHVHRLRLADEAGQPLRAAHAGDDAEVDLGLAELGVLGGDDEIAHHRQLAAAAERIARHRRDHRLAGFQDAVGLGAEEVLGEHVDEALLRHLLDIGTGRERLLRAGDDDAAHLVVLVRRGERIGQLAQQGRVQRVQGFGTVQPDQGDIVFDLDDQGLVGHVAVPFLVLGRSRNRVWAIIKTPSQVQHSRYFWHCGQK